MYTDFAILIPTRNRPLKVSRLLSSIESLSIKPVQIVIVASGEDIGPTIAPFSNLLPITYKHTNSAGQIAQKKIGITLLNPVAGWCLFLDDDLLIEPYSIVNAFEAVNSFASGEAIGVGLSLPPTTRSRDSNFFLRIVARFFGIRTNPPGRVFKNGHASSYLQEKEIAETQWLNGASLWRSDYLYSYGKGLPSPSYAACEDLIFSYPLSKVGKLIYAPNAKLQFQERELSNFDSPEVMEAAAFWRLYFVSRHDELSKWFFAFTQIGRAVFAIFRTKKNKLHMIQKMIRIEVKIIQAIRKQKNPNNLLNQLIN